MNYKIKSNIGQLTLGGEIFNSTLVDLVSVRCLQEGSYEEFFKSVEKGDLSIYKNGVELEKPLPVVSRLINIHATGEFSDDSLLNEDWNDQAKIKSTGFVSPQLIDIDKSYLKKINDGHVFYRKKRAETVLLINLGQITSQDAFFIDKKMRDVKASLLSGDWLTASMYLEESIPEGVYTQAIKEEYSQEIAEYISENYTI